MITDRRRRFGSGLLLLAFVMLAARSGGQTRLGHPKRVLVLYSVSRDSQLVNVGNEEIPRVLREGLPDGIDYYTEYLEIERFRVPGYQIAFRDYLSLKYQEQRLDVIIAISTPVVEFVQANRAELFPDTPVVFFESDNLSRTMSNATGVVAQLDLAGTVELAHRLQPDLRQVFVIVGSDANNDVLYSVAQKQLQPLASELEITYLTAIARNDLEVRLATLPPHSMVFYLSYSRDTNEDNFHPLLYLERALALANAPTYSWVDSTMGRGIVGGVLKSQSAQMSAVAKRALRVLRGESAPAIPTTFEDLNAIQIDWRQLRRWSIEESRVPVEAVVLFREPTAWERYKQYILGVCLMLAAQSALIGLLLIQHIRRRQAEGVARRSQAQLQTSYDRIRDLAGRLLMAQEVERSRIARELHDDVGQQLALLAIDLELTAAASGDSEAETLIAESLARARGISKSVHELSHRLHPEKLHLLGLATVLRALSREFSRDQLAISFENRNAADNLPQDVTLCLYRVAQEALLNIVKHSGATRVSIVLAGTNDEILFTIQDNGCGFDLDAATGSGLGLISMTERTEAVGASLQISTTPGAGTRLTVTVPTRAAVVVPATASGEMFPTLGH